MCGVDDGSMLGCVGEDESWAYEWLEKNLVEIRKLVVLGQASDGMKKNWTELKFLGMSWFCGKRATASLEFPTQTLPPFPQMFWRLFRHLWYILELPQLAFHLPALLSPTQAFFAWLKANTQYIFSNLNNLSNCCGLELLKIP